MHDTSPDTKDGSEREEAVRETAHRNEYEHRLSHGMKALLSLHAVAPHRAMTA
jgi:hypothetical protein